MYANCRRLSKKKERKELKIKGNSENPIISKSLLCSHRFHDPLVKFIFKTLIENYNKLGVDRSFIQLSTVLIEF